MAQRPRGEPRSVPDLAGERYDEMIQRERANRQVAEIIATNTTSSLDVAPYTPFGGLDDVRQSRVRSPTMKIGGRMYREIDNGLANVLMPIDDPLFSPAELAKRQQAIRRAAIMASHPLGGAAYGLSALTPASPQARESALMVGGLADTVMMGAAPRGAFVRRRPAPPRVQPALPTSRRPDIRSEALNAAGQARGVNATVTRSMLNSGTKSYWRLKPPGWQGDGNIYNEARGHLLAAQLGGSGRDMRNLVTQTQNGSNVPQMQGFEREVASRVREGEVVEYAAKPLYDEGVLPPAAILLTAHGSRGAPVARLIRNPAGRRK